MLRSLALCRRAPDRLLRRGRGQQPAPVVKSARSGPWSAAATWEGGKVPAAGAQGPGPHRAHRRLRRASPTDVIRSIHVAGTLSFARDRRHPARRRPDQDPGRRRRQRGRLRLRRPRAGPEAGRPRPALEVGTPEQPIPASNTALIRLHPSRGMDKESCPAIVCCGGRMDFHGAPLSRTWVKLGAAGEGRRQRGHARRGGHRLARRRPRHRHRDHAADQARRRRSSRSARDEHARPRSASITAHRRRQAHARQAAGVRPRRRGRLPRRGRQPEPQRRRRVGRPRQASAATRCTTATRPARSATPSSATSARRACSAGTACTSTCAATRCAAAPSSAPRSGTATTAGSPSTAPTTSSSATASATRASATASSSRTAPRSTTSSTATSPCRRYIGKPLPEAGAAVRQERRLRLLVGQQPQHLHAQRRLPSATSTATSSRPTKTDGLRPGPRRAAARRHAEDGRHPHAAVRPLRGQRGPLPAPARLQPRRRRAVRRAERRRRRAGRAAPVRHPQPAAGTSTGRSTRSRRRVLLDNLDVHNAEYGVWRPVYKQHVYRERQDDAGAGRTCSTPSSTGPPPNDEATTPSRSTRWTTCRRSRSSPTSARTAASCAVRGTTADNGQVTQGAGQRPAGTSHGANFAEWEVTLKNVTPGELQLTAQAEDAAGNGEARQLVVTVRVRREK